MQDAAAWFQAEKDGVRARLLKYSKKAFDMIPPVDEPQILDAGCGSGVSAVELTGWSNGHITCIDIDEKMLEVLRGKIEKYGLGERISIVSGSILDMDFPEHSFDIIWAEGSIYAIGFGKGLIEWGRLLKPGGCMVIHDAEGNVKGKIRQIADCGYDLLGHFVLDIDVWREEYFIPLENLIDKAQAVYGGEPGVLEMLGVARREVEMFNKSPENNSSECFVIRKNV